MKIERLNPDTLYHSPVFSQAISVTNPGKLIFVGGQNGIDTSGKLVGDDIASQSVQALRNVIAALEAGGATMKDVVSMTISIVQGQDIREAFAASQELLDKDTPPSTVNVLVVAGLAVPGALIEIQAIAAIS